MWKEVRKAAWELAKAAVKEAGPILLEVVLTSVVGALCYTGGSRDTGHQRTAHEYRPTGGTGGYGTRRHGRHK